MSDPDFPEAADAPEATALLLAIFTEFYRQELAAEEDVVRSLPFFGTAIGLVFAAPAYAAGRLPGRPQSWAEQGSVAFLLAVLLLGVATVEAGCVLVWLSRAIAYRHHERIGPEGPLKIRMTELMASPDYEQFGRRSPGSWFGKRHAAHVHKFLRDRDPDQPDAESTAHEIPRLGIVASHQKLDLGSRRDHCDLYVRQAGLSPEGDAMNKPIAEGLPLRSSERDVSERTAASGQRAASLHAHLTAPITYTVGVGADVWPWRWLWSKLRNVR